MKIGLLPLWSSHMQEHIWRSGDSIAKKDGSFGKMSKTTVWLNNPAHGIRHGPLGGRPSGDRPRQVQSSTPKPGGNIQAVREGKCR